MPGRRMLFWPAFKEVVVMETGNGENKRLMTNAGGGVEVGIAPIVGDELTISYHGPLSGASKVWLHMGYGPGQEWQHICDVPMVWTGESWEAIVRRMSGSQLNFCFRDNVGNWDNNAGNNWSFAVEEPHL